jgi:hypothetical protein
MELNGNEKRGKTKENEEKIYYCQKCHYECCIKYNWDRHLVTAKHTKETLGNNSSSEKGKNEEHIYYDNVCEKCNKQFATRSGLWKHTNKHCNPQNNDSVNKPLLDKDIIGLLIKENSELKTMMMKVLENGTHNTNNINNTNNTNNTNSHNKSFNLNFFLNETCKDAMNITDFVSSIKLSLEDLENTGRQGYIEGISEIILKNLNKLEQHMRPLHCSDFKRETLYIKDNNEWTKETEDKPILTKAIKIVANENIKQIKNWRDKNPKCVNSDSKKNNLYLKIVSNSMNGSTEVESHKNITKIISNIVKEVLIDK